MRSGDLDKYITLQQKTKVADGYGSFAVTWADVASLWAAIWPSSASEAVKNMQQTMEITHRIRIRYRSVMRPDWRIKFGNRYFAIVSILNPSERSVWLDLICKEIL